MRSEHQLIEDGAHLGRGVRIGAFVHVCKGVRIGDDVSIGDHVTIHDGVHIGAGTLISDGAIVGKPPMLASSSTAPRVEFVGASIGRECLIGAHAIILAGAVIGDGVVVGDGALVRERTNIGERVIIGRGVTVENDTTIGARTKIQAGAYVTAYVTIEEDVFIAPMVVTTNDNFMGRTARRFDLIKGCTIRRGARVGGGAHILPGIEIGEEAFVATGSVVTRDVPPRTLVMGVPARAVRAVPEDELLGRHDG